MIALLAGAKAGLCAMVVLLLAFYGFLAFAYLRPGVLGDGISAISLLAALVGIPLIAGLMTYAGHRNVRRLSMALEHHYPNLRGRMLTAAELSQGHNGRQEDPWRQALASSLITEMGCLLRRFHFARAYRPKKLAVPALILMSLLIGGTVHATVQPEFFAKGYRRMTGPEDGDLFSHGSRDSSRPSFTIKVFPGDCKVIKGNSLEVKASAVGRDPERMEFYVKHAKDPSWQVYGMTSKGEGNFEFLWTHITEPSHYFVKADGETSAVFDVQLYEPLGMTRVLWKLHFPEYMNLKDQTQLGWKRKITLPEGTKIDVAIQMNQPVKEGRLMVKGGDAIVMKKDVSKTALGASLEVDGDLVLDLEIQGEKGDPLLGMSSLWIQALPDLLPYVEILQPQLQGYVYPTEEIPFEISVNDDYGVKSVTLVVHARGEEKRIEWIAPGQNPTETLLYPVLELERFHLDSRDLVFAYLEVLDNNPAENREPVRSAMMSFLIRDYVEQFRMNDPASRDPSLRTMFEDLLVDQEKILQDTWDYLSMSPRSAPVGWDEEVVE